MDWPETLNTAVEAICADKPAGEKFTADELIENGLSTIDDFQYYRDLKENNDEKFFTDFKGTLKKITSGRRLFAKLDSLLKEKQEAQQLLAAKPAVHATPTGYFQPVSPEVAAQQRAEQLKKTERTPQELMTELLQIERHRIGSKTHSAAFKVSHQTGLS